MDNFKRAYRDPKSPLTPLTPLSVNNTFNFCIDGDDSLKDYIEIIDAQRGKLSPKPKVSTQPKFCSGTASCGSQSRQVANCNREVSDHCGSIKSTNYKGGHISPSSGCSLRNGNNVALQRSTSSRAGTLPSCDVNSVKQVSRSTVGSLFVTVTSPSGSASRSNASNMATRTNTSSYDSNTSNCRSRSSGCSVAPTSTQSFTSSKYISGSTVSSYGSKSTKFSNGCGYTSTQYTGSSKCLSTNDSIRYSNSSSSNSKSQSSIYYSCNSCYDPSNCESTASKNYTNCSSSPSYRYSSCSTSNASTTIKTGVNLTNTAPKRCLCGRFNSKFIEKDTNEKPTGAAKSFINWACQQLSPHKNTGLYNLLKSVGMEKYWPIFKQQEITDMTVFSTMTMRDLNTIGITDIADCLALLQAVAKALHLI